jgi:hypothetical protein
VQFEAEIMPAILLYLPVLQFLHCESLMAPLVSLHVPALQSVQLLSEIEASLSENLPAPQFSHPLPSDVAPVAIPYLPLPQPLQAEVLYSSA